MRVKKEVILQNSTPHSVLSPRPFSNDDYSVYEISNPIKTRSREAPKYETAQGSGAVKTGPGNICGEESLKLSYIILNEHISESNAIGLLGRVVGNVKSPLEHYAPVHIIPGVEIPELEPKRPSSSLSEQSVVSSTATIVNGQPEGLDIYPDILVFRNLPYVIGESAIATLSHSSYYTRESRSLLTSLLGLSVNSSRKTWKEFKLESKLIRTVSLTHHDLVWSNLSKVYKSQVISAVRKCGGTMFLVVGVKIARDAEVEVTIAGKKGLGGKLEVDPGAYMGVKDLGVGRVTGGTPGVVGIGSMERVKGAERQRKETIYGDRAFAIEYRQVKLKLKMEIGKPNGKQKPNSKGGEEQPICSNANGEVVTLNSNMGGDRGRSVNELLRVQQEKNERLEQQLKQQAEALEALQQRQQLQQHQLNHYFERFAPPALTGTRYSSSEPVMSHSSKLKTDISPPAGSLPKNMAALLSPPLSPFDSGFSPATESTVGMNDPALYSTPNSPALASQGPFLDDAEQFADLISKRVPPSVLWPTSLAPPEKILTDVPLDLRSSPPRTSRKWWPQPARAPPHILSPIVRPPYIEEEDVDEDPGFGLFDDSDPTEPLVAIAPALELPSNVIIDPINIGIDGDGEIRMGIDEDDDDLDKYELELGDGVYVQELDTLF